ncbi:hypothetical protein BDZ85DRAFT_255105 [Elsinoe ampelina]|uniref:Uncharacterized protein n=1 Tax=Elsinoe ampelina TaxID=302913 RepID=A0A6A6GQY4_9PEZI|nr:hypothetical protein BDZ85DRAFT_255105 [Elsinoe ampelina]
MPLSKRERGIAARAEKILHDRYLLAQMSGEDLDLPTEGSLDSIKHELREQRRAKKRDAQAPVTEKIHQLTAMVKKSLGHANLTVAGKRDLRREAKKLARTEDQSTDYSAVVQKIIMEHGAGGDIPQQQAKPSGRQPKAAKKKTTRSRRKAVPGGGRTDAFTFDFNDLSQAVPLLGAGAGDAMEQDAAGETDAYGEARGDLVSTQPNMTAGKTSNVL